MRLRKKVLSFLLSGAMAATAFSAMPAAAVTRDVLLGDTDGNGVVDISDAVSILQYLAGIRYYDKNYLTRMDFNEDGVIDSTDALMVQYVEIKTIQPQVVNKEIYTISDPEKREYIWHDCNSPDATSSDDYTLSENPLDDEIFFNTCSTTGVISESRDKENTNVVQIEMNGAVGSGFIINNHIVATAAHCVYDFDSDKFYDVKVNIYKQDGAVSSANLLHTSPAKEIHIPEQYISANDKRCNYDYALIYVEDDLSEYGVWSAGVFVDDFTDSGRFLTTSGFRTLNGTYARYYDEGAIMSTKEWGAGETDLSDPNYRFQSKGLSFPGKSGGIVYYKSDYNGTLAKSAVGIVTGASNIVTGGNTWAVRMTPTLLHFYKSNSNIKSRRGSL